MTPEPTEYDPVPMQPCPECDGEGGKDATLDGYEWFLETCHMCNGTGKTEVEE